MMRLLFIFLLVVLSGCTWGEDTTEEQPYWSFDLQSEYPKELWFEEGRGTDDRPEPGRHVPSVKPNSEWGGITYGCVLEEGVFFEVRFVEVATEKVVAHESWQLKCEHYELLVKEEGMLSLEQEKGKSSPSLGATTIVILIGVALLFRHKKGEG